MDPSSSTSAVPTPNPKNSTAQNEELPLPLDDYKRYGRQMILDGFGLQGQVSLSRASVAVVGAGGLGCPALQYLGAAGIGHIGIIDHDRVEMSNLSRQILHDESTVRMYKAESAKRALLRVNSRLKITTHVTFCSSSNALSLLAPYDLVLDCTDNVPTRYLLSDAAAALRKPLVSGAAQKFDGQLAVYGLGENGPCYRCVFPVPPKPANVGSCEELGILGAVTGIIGAMQAAEAVKILAGLHDENPVMHIYNALSIPPFRTIKLRSRRENCPACGKDSTKDALVNETDYVQFCGGPAPDWETTGLVEGEEGERIDAKSLKYALNSTAPPEIIDVRNPTEFGICHLPGSKNIPLKEILANPAQYVPSADSRPVVFTCRLGNDSQVAVEALRHAQREQVHGHGLLHELELELEHGHDQERGSDGHGELGGDAQGKVLDLVGGLRAWSRDVDQGFPEY